MRIRWLCLIVWLLWGCDREQPALDFRVVGYLYGPRMDSLPTLELSGLTDLNYAFANVHPDGRVVLETSDDSARLRQLAGMRAAEGPRILL